MCDDTKPHTDSTAGDGRARDLAAAFAAHRAYLFAVAYRMVGVAADAEDILQEAWLRFSSARLDNIDNLRSYLVTIVTRLCVDLMRSARRRREHYVGVWLPEPVPTPEALPDALEAAESASFAFLLLLERLSPQQRAVLLLHDVFDYSHDEVADVMGCSTAASRQMLHRARQRLGEASRPKSPPTAEVNEIVSRFFSAAQTGDVDALIAALAPDVVLMSDGGGKVAAVNRPLAGSTPVGRFFGAVGQHSAGSSAMPFHLNGQPAALIYEGGELTNAMVFDVTGAGITAIYVVRNPDKLRRLQAAASS